MRVTGTRLALASGLVAFAGFFGFRAYEARATENRLSAIASEIAGRHVRVECQGTVGAALDVGAESGSVWFGESGRRGDVTQLKREICRELTVFAD